MKKHTYQMNGKQIANILVENCYKCFSPLGDNRVKDHNGNEYCCEFCRREFYAENRKEMDARYNDWIRR